MRRVHIPIFLLAIAGVFICPGCGKIKGAQFPYVASPRVIVGTPASPAEGNIAISFRLMDREVEPADVTVEYSTDGGQTYNTATLTVPGDAANLASAWHPGKTHSVTWNSVTDMVGRSGAVSVCVKITPSDASNPSGTPGISGSFTVNNIAYNEAPTATAATPAGVQTGNVQINYFLADVESDTCSIAVLYSTNDGTSYQAATMGPAGDGVSGLSSSPSGTPHVYLWDSRADNVAPSGQVDTIKIRITPTDFNAGTAGDTNSFSVDNSVANDPPTVTITGGPADGSTVTTTQVTFTWSGSDTDGSVVGYYYSFDHDPPDVWITDTTVTSGALSEASHIFRVVAVDDDSDLSTVASRSFTVSIPGTITADFSGSPLTGTAPLTVNFTDLSTSTNGIDTWSWNFGDSETSTQEDPSHQYISAGSYTVSLTVTGPDGTDPETKTNYITATSPGGDTICVDGVGGDDGRSGLDWANAVLTIQTGLDKAQSGWIVIVANGIYTGVNNKNLDFGGRAIYLKSAGGAANCIIDCEDSGRGLYFNKGEMDFSVVEGLTIQNGSISSGNGGGILCENLSSPTIRNCVIQDCSVSPGGCSGGGIYCDNSNPRIENCTITKNRAGGAGGGVSCRNSSNPRIANSFVTENTASGAAGGILCTDASSPLVSNCTITSNTAGPWGAGIYCYYRSDLTLRGCIVAGNSTTDLSGTAGGGIYCVNDCNLDISNCTITDNSAGDGGGISTRDCTGQIASCIICNNTGGSGGGIFCNGDTGTSPHFRIINCLIRGNNAGNGGGIYVWGGSPTEICYVDIINCTITGNDAAGSGGGGGALFVSFAAAPKVQNSILWGNTAAEPGAEEVFVYFTAESLQFSYTDINPARVCDDTSPSVITWGTIITADPLFSDPVSDDYHLGNGSPCTDAGYNWSLPTGVTMDLDGNVRIFDGDGDSTATVDMGAYEYGSGPPNPAYGWTRVIKGWDINYALDMCVNQNDDIHIAGYWRGTVNFAADWNGSDGRKTKGAWDTFVTKIDSSQGYCWTRTMGGTGSDRIYGVCTDLGGDVYVTGQFDATVDFQADWGGTDQKTSAGDYDVFVTKINSDGTYGWTRVIGGPLCDEAHDICADSDGNVYITGFFSDTVNFAQDWGGDDTKTAEPAVHSPCDIFVTRVNADGTYGWTHVMGGTGEDAATSICAYGSNCIYLTGYYNSNTVNFAKDWGGTDIKDYASGLDVFISKLDTDGGYCWTKVIAAPWDQAAHSICTNSSGDIFIAGEFRDSVNFAVDWGGTEEKTSIGNEDIFVTKITSDGAYGWTHVIGRQSSDAANVVCTDKNDDVYVAGQYWATNPTMNFALDWGGTDERSKGKNNDAFVTKLNSNGDYCWSRTLVGPQNVIAFGACVDSKLNLYLTGGFNGTVNFGEDFDVADERAGPFSMYSTSIFVTNIFQP